MGVSRRPDLSSGPSFAVPRTPGTPPTVRPSGPRLKVRQRLGKYRLVRRLAEGGFAQVFEALDTIEGIRVALKVPRSDLVDQSVLEQFRREVRTHSAMDHPNVLPIKNADVIDGHFVIAVPLGEESLADRMQRRMALTTALDFARQLLEALAHAHEHRIVHCDVKPENLLLFADGTLRLADFGIAKMVRRTVRGSGSGTLGYMAPEQAFGRTSLRGDVFAAGLVIWRLLSGELPEWPFQWPLAGATAMRRKVPEDLIKVLRRSLSVEPRGRYRDAEAFLAAWDRVWPRVERLLARRRRARR